MIIKLKFVVVIFLATNLQLKKLLDLHNIQ